MSNEWARNGHYATGIRDGGSEWHIGTRNRRECDRCAPDTGAEERLRAALRQGPPFRGKTYDRLSPQEGHALGWSEAMAHVRAALARPPWTAPPSSPPLTVSAPLPLPAQRSRRERD